MGKKEINDFVFWFFICEISLNFTTKLKYFKSPKEKVEDSSSNHYTQVSQLENITMTISAEIKTLL